MGKRVTVLAGALLAVSVLASAGMPPEATPLPLLESSREWSAPFEAGEKLVYEVNWKALPILPAFKAGEISIAVEDSEWQGIPTYKIRAWAVSGGALARIAGMEVRNYYESEVDRANFRSYHILQQTREGAKQRDLDLRFDYASGTTFVRETDPAEKPPRLVKAESKAGIPGPIVDVLSVFYVTRLRAINQNSHYQFHLNTRGEIERVHLRGEAVEKISTDVGRFPAQRITTIGGLFKGGGDFRLWLSRTPARFPVQFEADVKLGKVYGKLIRMESPHVTRSRIRTQ